MDWGKVLVNGHQVISLAPGFRELPLQELIERTKGCQDLLLHAVLVNGRELDPRRIVLNQELLLRR